MSVVGRERSQQADARATREILVLPEMQRQLWGTRKRMMELQPIETAPKDGRSILAVSSENVFIGAWGTWYSESLQGEVTGWWSVGAKNYYQAMFPIEPTHWHQLPDFCVGLKNEGRTDV